MAVGQKHIILRLYLVFALLVVTMGGILYKIIDIQMVKGSDYQALAHQKTEKLFTIEPNRGNIYADDGSLLAASTSKYEIRWDANSVQEEEWQKNYAALSDSLGQLFDKPASYYKQMLRKARAEKNGYQLIARNIDYATFSRIRNFPIFKKGPFKGGFIEKHKVVREYPLGGIAARTIGYEKQDDNGYFTRVGLDGAFGESYLRGKEGKRLKQKSAGKHWKPVHSENDVEPKDGVDIVSSINTNIQDIAHHALLAQLERYKADHGTVVVMETKTGAVKAISNLARTEEGTYYEKLNYAVGESHEPGSTFKLMTLIAALEDGKVDTNTLVDTGKGRWKIYDRVVKDSKEGGYGKIKVADAFKVSSNTAFAQIIHNNYKNNPEKFINRLMSMGLHEDLNLPIIGEGQPVLRYPGDKGWSGISLAWLSHGYEVSMTPMQVLTFYNAIANNGKMVKPKFALKVKSGERVLKEFDTEVMISSICSESTLGKVQKLLSDVVNTPSGTAFRLKNPFVTIAGKTGTCQKNYVARDPDKLAYISSFVGYFPAENPKYSCIVVIHEPDKNEGYYGADVSGPVFSKVAQKIYTSLFEEDRVPENFESDALVKQELKDSSIDLDLNSATIPKLRGLPGMEAISVLENMGIKVEVEGNGKVTAQSVKPGTPKDQIRTIKLTLS